MEKRFTLLVLLIKKVIGLFVSVSVGIFLFILFFQPFPLTAFDFNNRLLFVAGFGAIVFILIFIVSAAYLWIIYKDHQNNTEPGFTSYLSSFIILALCSVAFAFYLRYVGSVSITFFITFKVVIICLVPPVILKLYDIRMGLMRQNESLISERKKIQKQIEKYEEDNLNKSVVFISESKSENLSLLVSEIIFVQSADNYVEIVYMEGENVKKKLIRNTLKNIEVQLKPYSNFIRCHRTCIVNLHFIVRLHKDFNSNWLEIKGYQEKIPVSRQYLIKLKEAI